MQPIKPLLHLNDWMDWLGSQPWFCHSLLEEKSISEYSRSANPSDLFNPYCAEIVRGFSQPTYPDFTTFYWRRIHFRVFQGWLACLTYSTLIVLKCLDRSTCQPTLKSISEYLQVSQAIWHIQPLLYIKGRMGCPVDQPWCATLYWRKIHHIVFHFILGNYYHMLWTHPGFKVVKPMKKWHHPSSWKMYQQSSVEFEGHGL